MSVLPLIISYRQFATRNLFCDLIRMSLLKKVIGTDSSFLLFSGHCMAHFNDYFEIFHERIFGA